MKHSNTQQGFSLVELMITLALGLIISGALIQIMVGNNITERLNQAVASVQESGRFIISRLRNDLLMTGRYDILAPALNRNGVDVAVEAAFVQNHPVPLPGDFINDASVGAIEGTSGANDTLVVSFQGVTDCSGVNQGYGANEEFFVVNQYFVSGTSLQCRGFDGRNLVGTNLAYTLLDDVYSFQVQYGVTNTFASQDNSSVPVSFVTADRLAALRAGGSQVVAIRIAVLIRADSDVNIDPVPSFKLLDETAIQPSQKRLFKQFETTITLRNVKNFIRSRNI
ncbi:PilW family protein [Paraglaciecola sp.]|uniref:PilW family protein n=1 Tax=Paraglaciecola sp. TaxID=1920173 RepID=UPI0030F3C072